MVLALVVLVDLAKRAANLRAHYGEEGVLPPGIALEELSSEWTFSLNLINGHSVFQGLLFVVAAVAALSMLVGYRTRLMTIVVWILLLSIANRNLMVLNSGDTFLRMLVFWSMFLPLGAYWSVDRFLEGASRARSRLSTRFASVATAALLLQIAFVYVFTAILKDGDEWRVDGTALYYALQYEQLVTPFGEFLSRFPSLLEFMTFATFWLEAVGPFLLFIPFFWGLVRFTTALAFAGLQLGIGMSMELGTFSLIGALCMVCFFPGWFWDRGGELLDSTFPKQVGALRRLSETAARLGQERLPGLLADLRALVAQPRTHLAGSMSGRVGIAQGRHKVTADPANERRRGRGDKPSPERPGVARPALALRPSRFASLAAGFFLMYVFLWNLTTVSDYEMPESIEPVGYALDISQDWGVFAPYPPKSDGWFVIPGVLESGREVDMMTVVHGDFSASDEVSFDKPDDVSETYEDKYWRKYLGDIRDEDTEEERLYLGKYICNEWNSRYEGGMELDAFDIMYLEQETLPDYRRAEIEQNVLWEDFDCS